MVRPMCVCVGCGPVSQLPSISLAKAQKAPVPRYKTTPSASQIRTYYGARVQILSNLSPSIPLIIFGFCFFFFFFLTGSYLAKAILECLILQWSEIPGVYYCAWLPALASSLFKRQGLTRQHRLASNLQSACLSFLWWITGIYHQAMSSRSLGSYPDNQNLVCWANGPGSTKADMVE